MDMKILVTMHKPHWTPRARIYYPIYCGRQGKKVDWIDEGDDTGDNISGMNPYYSECTGMYWAWKNLSCDVIGLCHYRRYFCRTWGGVEHLKILDEKDFISALDGYDMVLPNMDTGDFERFTVFEQYASIHNGGDLMVTRKIIQKDMPQYLQAFDEVMRAHAAYTCNMFCTRKEIFDAYCEWLFHILFQIENQIDYQKRDNYQRRVFGFIAERLLNVWVKQNRLRINEVDVVGLDDENKIKRWVQEMIF